jgi:hypothetical protein
VLRLIPFALVGVVLAAGFCTAGTITSIDIQLGSWDGSTFTTDGSQWNTYNADNWAIGATAPGFGNPLLDGFDSVSLPDGEYYLYMADNDDDAGAIQIILGYSGGPVTEVFTYAGSPQEGTPGPYTLVSGSGFTASLVTPPQSTYLQVSSGQIYSPSGDEDWVIDLNSGSSVPEPSSWLLVAGGVAGLLFARRRKALRQPGN